MIDIQQHQSRAAFEAYGWDDLAKKLAGRPGATTPWPEKPEYPAEAEEAQGKIRWLRPEYQVPEETGEQGQLETESPDNKPTNQPTSEPANQPTKKLVWPKTLQAQIRAVRDQLETAPMDATTLAAQYKRKPEKSVAQVLDALVELGMIRTEERATGAVYKC